MSTQSQKANLARIRDNQRRSRARRKEYLQELEQRLRVCELQGIEASAEVQMAARRVADENKQLKELLNKYGVTDEYIGHYLQASTTSNPPVASQGHDTTSTSTSTDAGATQSLQQLLMPRRAAHLDQTVQFPPPTGRSSREDSITSGSTTHSSAWEPAQAALTAYSHHPTALGVASNSIGTSDRQQQYSLSSAFVEQPATTQANPPFHIPCSAQMMADPRQAIATTQAMPMDTAATGMSYPFQMNPFSEDVNRYVSHGGGGC